MRQAVLLGSPGTKRSIFLEQAAVKEGLPVLYVDWKDWESGAAHLPEGELFVKIDPPVWESCRLEELELLTGQYRGALDRLARLGEERQITFFNHPSAILMLLDKRLCKAKLRETGLPVTEELLWPGQETPDRDAARSPVQTKVHVQTKVSVQTKVHVRPVARMYSAEELLESMRAQRMFQVFIKPVYGSGAAGVSAFRFQPGTGRMALYTCAQLHPECGLVNTKRLRCFTKREEILPLLEGILALSCIVERWYAKAQCGGYSYDLRMVMQEGEPDFLLARLSKGPITNLHLNNHPMECSELGLPARVREEAADLCRRAMACFPGLTCAGIDLLPERGSLALRIIEMNAQGDLIYQDMYRENRIYRHQAVMMKRWLEGK